MHSAILVISAVHTQKSFWYKWRPESIFMWFHISKKFHSFCPSQKSAKVKHKSYAPPVTHKHMEITSMTNHSLSFQDTGKPKSKNCFYKTAHYLAFHLQIQSCPVPPKAFEHGRPCGTQRVTRWDSSHGTLGVKHPPFLLTAFNWIPKLWWWKYGW